MHFCKIARLSVLSAFFLIACFKLPAAAQNAAKLSITATPLGAAAKEAPIPVSALAEIEIVLKNEAADTIQNVVLTAKLRGAKLAQDSEWKAEGDDAVLQIAAIKANETVRHVLPLRIEMAPLPPGRLAEIAIEAKAGDASAGTLAKFPAADCASAFQADLTRLRITTISEIWPTADDMRKQDTSLPRTRLFRIGLRRGDLGTIDRVAAGYQARLLSDHNFFDQGVRYTARRWSDELKAFAGQEPNPGLCAVNSQMYDGIRKTIHYVTARIEPPQKAYVRALDQVRKTLSAGESEDLRAIALRKIEEAGAKIENPEQLTLKLLVQAKENLKDKKLTEAQLDELSLIESAAWIEAQALRAKKLSDLIDGTINGIAEAQKKNCVCAF